MNIVKDDNNYGKFLREIKERIYRSQYDALKAVNKELISLYWDIGRDVVEKQKLFGWGKSVVEKLAKDLQKEFPKIHGFSSKNIWRMKQFYQVYCDNPKLSPVVREIGWTHNIIIIMGCKNDLEREFYIKMTKRYGWSKNVLIHQIENKSYEKFLLNQTNFDKTVPEKYRHQAKFAVKDEYTFDFLELSEEHSEKQLEVELINNIRKFLIEMGGYFAFVGNQYRIEVEDNEYFIDLLLYHRVLRCLVAVELKIGDFKPEYAGKMQFYLSALDDKSKLKDENPSIGIILCKSKKRTIVEYALRNVNKPIGIAIYKITDKLPKKLQKYLPSPKEISEILKNM
ncbi:MAG: hypothetical protein A2539_03365 [Elusimicrobia bacterium RIFOXYD2_FULL_34_15]|nr:MAG: hypothetical protein A2539_03365 [Elusimicrobia bacterium RIFOXYD2_FULL_34_15]